MVPSPEADVLGLLLSNAASLRWFHNVSEGWATAAGNEGRTDTSAVLVGNVLDAPIRRDGFLIGFMLASKGY